MKKSIAAFLLFATLFSSAQDNVLVKGYVLDKSNNEPLSLAALQLKNSQLGALSEDNGYFELPLPKTSLKDSLRISFLGYLPKTISIANYKKEDTLKIFLETQIATKEEAVITSYNARGVLLKAIAKLKANLWTDSVLQTGFYRQYHKENGKYVRLIESESTVAFNVKSPYVYSFHELVQTLHQRRGANFETNGDVHGDHFVDLLKENPFSYNRSNFLNAKMIDFFAPKFESEDSVQYIIKTQYKESSSAKLEQARIWVQKETFAILRIEVEKFPNPYYVKTRYAKDSRWKLVNEKDVCELKNIDGKFFVSALKRSYNHHVLNRQTGNVDFVVEESFQLFFEKYDTIHVGAKIKNGNFVAFTSFYTSAYKYDEQFWSHYGLLKEHPLDPEVKKDMERAKSLDDQFRTAGQ